MRGNCKTNNNAIEDGKVITRWMGLTFGVLFYNMFILHEMNAMSLKCIKVCISRCC